MTPVTREEIYLYKLAGGSVTVPTPVSRKEMYLAKACGETVAVPDPINREEMYLYKLAGGTITLPDPVSRLELLMAAACGEAVTPYDPVSRLEWFWSEIITPTQTITGVPPIAFTSDGTPLQSWIIYGNGQQTGTPTPDAPIMPEFCGKLVGADWTIPLTCAGQTVPVYLGQVQTVRRVRKLVLDGTENWYINASVSTEDTAYFYTTLIPSNLYVEGRGICTHFEYKDVYNNRNIIGFHLVAGYGGLRFRIMQTIAGTIADFKAYLASEYANGTPVTVWYVLAEPQTATVNEPLCKIGTYADELRSEDAEDAGITIQTAAGSNTLTIGTDLQPSSVSITGYISQ